ncbi:transcription factor 7-like 1-B, partial [Tachysurus ichikawai]
YLQMKWPLLDVPSSAALKDSRSPTPGHLLLDPRFTPSQHREIVSEHSAIFVGSSHCTFTALISCLTLYRAASQAQEKTQGTIGHVSCPMNGAY